MSYPSSSGEGFKIFPLKKGGKASSLFTKASKGRRELDCIQCDVGSILYSQLGKSSKVSKTLRTVGTNELSLPTTKEVEYKIFGKSGKGSIPLKEGLSIPSGDKYKRRQLTSKGVKGSIGSSLSLPNITGKTGKASKGKSGKFSSLPPKEGLSIPLIEIEKEFRIFHQKKSKSNKDAAAGLPSSSPSVSSVPSASPSDFPSSSSAPSHEPSVQPSESLAPTENSAKARKLENTPFPTEPEPNTPFPTEPAPTTASKSSKSSGTSSSSSTSSSSDDYRRGRVMY